MRHEGFYCDISSRAQYINVKSRSIRSPACHRLVIIQPIGTSLCQSSNTDKTNKNFGSHIPCVASYIFLYFILFLKFIIIFFICYGIWILYWLTNQLYFSCSWKKYTSFGYYVVHIFTLSMWLLLRYHASTCEQWT